MSKEVLKKIREKAESVNDINKWLTEFIQIKMADKPFEKRMDRKDWVKVSDVEASLDGYACIKKEQLQKLWKDRPKTRGYNNEFYKCDELKKWFMKAEKVLGLEEKKEPTK